MQVEPSYFKRTPSETYTPNTRVVSSRIAKARSSWSSQPQLAKEKATMHVEHDYFKVTPTENYTPSTRVISPHIARLRSSWNASPSPTMNKENLKTMPKKKFVPKKHTTTLKFDKVTPSSSVNVSKTKESPKTPTKAVKISKKTQSSSTNGNSIKMVVKQPQSSQVNGRRKQHRTSISGKKKNDSAIMIQKLMRGWLQRLRFRILRLKHQLDSQEEQTQKSISIIYERLQKRKEAFREMMEKDEDEAYALYVAAREKAQALIAKLRKDNKKIREENRKLAKGIQYLIVQNEELEGATEHACESLGKLNGHSETINETHAKLRTVVPKFRSSITSTENAISVRHQYYASEQTIKMKYLKTIGKIVENVQKQCRQGDLVDEIVGKVLMLDDVTENSFSGDFFVGSDSDSSDNDDDSQSSGSIDEYFSTITLDSAT